MASSSEHTAIPASDEVVGSKEVASTMATTAITDSNNASGEPIASMEEEREANSAPSTSADILASNMDKLSLNKGDAAGGNAETSNPEAEANTTPAVEAQRDTEVEPIHDQADEAGMKERSSKVQFQSDEAAVESSAGGSEESKPSTSTTTSETPIVAKTDEQKEEQDSASSQAPPFQTASKTKAATSTEKPATAAAGPAELSADENDSPADESISPPTPPSKDGPQPPAKQRAIETKSGAAQSNLPSTPVAQRLSRAEREALADPESVAAVAHAFGRDSPALRSSTDTPQRIATPTDHARQTLPSTPSEKQKERLDSSSGDNGTGSGKDALFGQMQAATSSAATEQGAFTEAEKSKEDSKDETASRGAIRIGQGPPAASQASEEQPFDFNRFLEQMKHRSAQPVGEYVRSFIKGFAKKPYRTQDQIKLIFDFLDFIAARMRECDVWKNLSDTDFENAKEAMEKLVMNRLYPYTFTPAVQKEGRWAVQTDDLERDRVLRQRIGLFGWLSEEHLDVPVGDHSRGFIEFSIQELLKINHYKAPRDKLICILNCCKVIFGMIRHLSTQENADTFIPVLIFVVLKANPEHLISNVEYISRFRNPDRLSSESGYYLSSLMGAISFIETMDYTSLSNITQEEFEERVEDAVSSLPEPEPSAAATTAAEGSLLAPPTTPPPRGAQSPFGYPQHQRSVSANSVSAPSGPGEEAAKALPFTPMAASLADDTRAFFLRTGEAARTGLSRPMGALGRLINEGIEGIRTPSGSNNDSGASTERQNSPAPTSVPGSGDMPQSSSRPKLFGGLFGSLDTADRVTQPRTTGYPGQQSGRRSTILVNDEPQTPSTGDLAHQPYHAIAAGVAPNAPARLLQPMVPQRNHSNDGNMFDDESAGRRKLMATSPGGVQGQRDANYHDYDEDDETDATRPAMAEQMRRRMQMQQSLGRGFDDGDGFPGTPSRRAAGGEEQGRLQPGRREEIAYENAQTEQAIQRSLMDQEHLDSVHADQAAQNSASVETLKSIFPTMDDGVIQMVLQGCEGNVEMAIDRLLEMQ
ncbi:related to VPS9 (involved in vacuole trafficking) [Ustilago trichophora]|uniref:Related to VPS9 (Involved in vacuole trafficking) n=1 Tax=Ustilago trichophora TaxID=86804 RepID=A0A5C3EJN2_9BASI|nr:related to VPS9 (involved in vacuole trafficking) [Ustilago trichophora]